MLTRCSTHRNCPRGVEDHLRSKCYGAGRRCDWTGDLVGSCRSYRNTLEYRHLHALLLPLLPLLFLLLLLPLPFSQLFNCSVTSVSTRVAPAGLQAAAEQKFSPEPQNLSSSECGRVPSGADGLGHETDPPPAWVEHSRAPSSHTTRLQGEDRSG